LPSLNRVRLEVETTMMTDMRADQRIDQARARRSFPLPGTRLHDLLNKPEFRKEFHTRLKSANRLVVFLYQVGLLPLLGFGKSIMLLTTKGRTSQKRRDFPVGYYLIDGTVHLFSGWGKQANWYKNLVAYPDEVYVRIAFRRFHARPEVVEDAQELRSILDRFVRQQPGAAHSLLGWDPARDDPATADFSPMIERVLTVGFHKMSTSRDFA
jgi:deazaflavin-dependent oxidoreductase (nitroreductase family)